MQNNVPQDEHNKRKSSFALQELELHLMLFGFSACFAALLSAAHRLWKLKVG